MHDARAPRRIIHCVQATEEAEVLRDICRAPAYGSYMRPRHSERLTRINIDFDYCSFDVLFRRFREFRRRCRSRFHAPPILSARMRRGITLISSGRGRGRAFLCFSRERAIASTMGARFTSAARGADEARQLRFDAASEGWRLRGRSRRAASRCHARSAIVTHGALMLITPYFISITLMPR